MKIQQLLMNTVEERGYANIVDMLVEGSLYEILQGAGLTLEDEGNAFTYAYPIEVSWELDRVFLNIRRDIQSDINWRIGIIKKRIEKFNICEMKGIEEAIMNYCTKSHEYQKCEHYLDKKIAIIKSLDFIIEKL